MQNPEFSAQFDVLFNNITSNQAPGLDEYEKSVFLTKGQDEVIKNYFSPKGNPKQDGFDDSPKRQHDFSTLVQTKDLNPLVTSVSGGVGMFDHRGLDYKYKSDIFLVLNEQLYNKTTNFIYTINPISFDEYNRLMQKPYKYPPKNQVWRLMITNNVEAHTETITREVPVYAPGDGVVNVAQGTGTLDSVVGNHSPWRDINMFITMGVVGNWRIKVNFAYDSRSSITRVDYLTNFGPTVDTGNKEITFTIIPCVTLQDMVGHIDSQEYREAMLIGSVWDYIDAISFSSETANMKIELSTLSSYSSLSIFNSVIEEVDTGETTTETETITIPASTDRISELIGRWYGSTSDLIYRVRYVKRPKPIILVNLDTDNVEEGLGFEYAGQVLTSETPCELPESLHSEVLQRAVELAKIAWQGETQAIVTSGQRSE